MWYTPGIKYLKYIIFFQWQQIPVQMNAVNVLIVLVILLSSCFMSWLFYFLCISGHELNRFINSFHHCREQWGKFSHFIQLNAVFLQFSWFSIFDAITIIVQDTLTFFIFQFYHIPTTIFTFMSHSLFLKQLPLWNQ